MSDTTLPIDPKERKGIPIVTGVLDYFPLAIVEVARVSKAGNDQHNPGEPLHWDRSKSTDHADCAVRHLLDRGKFDGDGQRHSAKAAWRALALLQEELEAEQNKKSPEVSPGRQEQAMSSYDTKTDSKMVTTPDVVWTLGGSLPDVFTQVFQGPIPGRARLEMHQGLHRGLHRGLQTIAQGSLSQADGHSDIVDVEYKDISETPEKEPLTR